MPEGPETKRMVDTIKKSLINQELVSTSFYHENLEVLDASNITILDITSKGKAVVIRLSDGNSIITHNQLYGRWTSNRVNTKINHNRSLRIEFCTPSKAVRLWSATDITVLPTHKEDSHPYFINLGPDVLYDTTTHQLIYDRLTSKKFKNRRFSGLLLNQHFISGLGNYLRSEILFFAKCMYHQRSSDLNNEQNIKLAKSIKDVSVRAYEQKGKTIFYNDLMLKQLDKSAKKRRFMVFARAGKKCYICKNKIVKDFQSSRRIYFCRRCQTSSKE